MKLLAGVQVLSLKNSGDNQIFVIIRNLIIVLKPKEISVI